MSTKIVLFCIKGGAFLLTLQNISWKLPNGEEMCCSDCAELIEYLREILENK